MAVVALGWADTCLTPGNRLYKGGGQGVMGGPSSDPLNPNPNYIPSGQPGFGTSGPTDQDVADGTDACLTLEFDVPAPSIDKGYAGWGGLTLSFDKAIDGGSFVFDPACPTPADGTLGQVMDGGKNLVGPNQSITFSPGNYRLNPTGTPNTATNKDGTPKYPPGSQAANYSQFAVTIMYDTEAGVPQMLVTDSNGKPLSYWVGKPGKQNNGFTPYQGATGPGTPGVDYALVAPEPSFMPLLLCGCVSLGFIYRRRSGNLRRAIEPAKP
jgi:hypothetical protein